MLLSRNRQAPKSGCRFPKRGGGRARRNHLYRRQLHIEPLEGRLLLSIFPELTDSETVAFYGEDGADDLYLRVTAENVLEFSETGAEGSYSSDLDPTIAGDQTLTVTPSTVITVDLAGGADTLSVDASLSTALSLSGGSLTFGGGDGEDTLIGPDQVNTWNITGTGIGTLNTQVSFNGVEELKGADDNDDVFVFAPGGSIDGYVEGGWGGFDRIVLDGGTFARVSYDATGPDSGTIDRDGSVIAYSGMEPLEDNSDAANRVFTGTDIADQVCVKRTEPGKITIDSDNDVSTFESVTFADPSESLTINTKGGDDTITIEPLDSSFAARLTIGGGEGDDTVTVEGAIGVGDLTVTAAAGVVLSNDLTTTGSVDIETSRWIMVDAGVAITADGDIRLAVSDEFDQRWNRNANAFKDTVLEGRMIEIGAAAHLTAANVEITVDSRVKKIADFALDVLSLQSQTQQETEVARYEGEAAFSSADLTITRPDDGTEGFLADGFKVGQLIDVEETAGNDGQYQILTVEAFKITLEDTDTSGDPTILTDESATNASIVAKEVEAPPLVSLDPNVRLTGMTKLKFTPNLTAGAGRTDGGTIERRDGLSWEQDGFNENDLIWVMGTALNDGMYRIKAIEGDSKETLRLTSDAILAEETTRCGVEVVKVLEGASASTEELLNDQFGANIEIPEILEEQLSDQKPIDISGLRAQGVFSTAESLVTIAQGAAITATGSVAAGSGNVTILSTALSDVMLHTVAVKTGAEATTPPGEPIQEDDIGVTFASSEATARAIVESGVVVTANGDFSLTADVTNSLDVKTWIIGGMQGQREYGASQTRIKQAKGPALAITYGRAVSESEAGVGDGAIIAARNVTVDATNSNDFKVASESRIVRPKNMGLAAGVAASDVESNADAYLGGTVTSTADASGGGDVALSATSINENNDTTARASVRRNPGGSPVNSRLRGINFRRVNRTPDSEVAAAVALAESINRADAHVSPGTGTSITATNDVLVTSLAEDNFKAIASGASSAGGRTAIAGGVALTNYTNEATSFIGADATVMSAGGGTIDVAAEALVPDQLEVKDALRTVLSIDPSLPSFDTDSPTAFIADVYDFATGDPQQVAKDTLQGILQQLQPLEAFVNRNLGIDDKIATTYVSASARGEAGTQTDPQGPTEFALSWNINILTLNNTARAFVDEGATIATTQAPVEFAFDPSLPAEVDFADDDIHLGSPHGLRTGDPLIYRSQGNAPIGGLVHGRTYYAVVVDDTTIQLAESREQARQVAATRSGPLPDDPIDLEAPSSPSSSSHSLTRPGVQVDARASWETVDISGLSSLWSVFGREFDQLNAWDCQSAFDLKTKAEGSAIGATYVDLTKNNTAEAYIADGAAVNAAGDVQVVAGSHARAITVSEAGVEAGDMALGATIALNDFDNTTLAYIEDEADVTASNVTVGAETEVTSIAFAGSMQQDRTDTQSGVTNQSKTQFGAGASIAINDIDSTTHAFIGDISTALGTGPADPTTTPGRVAAEGDVSVAATANERLYSIALAGEGPDNPNGGRTGVHAPDYSFHSPRNSGGIDLSGVVSINELNDDSQAFVADGVTLSLGGDLAIDANTNATVLNVSLPFALDRYRQTGPVSSSGQPALGVAGAYAENVLGQTTLAFTRDVTVSSVADVTIAAATSNDLVSITAGAAGQVNRRAPTNPSQGQRGATIAGSFNINEITTVTEASLGGDMTDATPGTVTVDARDSLTLISVAGGLVNGTAQFGVGAGIDLSTIASTVRAFIADSAQVTNVEGNVQVTAASDKSIISVAASVARNAQDPSQNQSRNLGLAGSGSSQTVANIVEAFVGSGATVSTDGHVLIDADDRVDLVVVAGAAAGTTGVGVGVSVAEANVDRAVRAFVGDGAAINAMGNGAAISDPSGSVSGNGLIIDASAADDIHIFAAAGAKVDELAALAGSVSLVSISGSVEAFIGAGTSVAAGTQGDANREGLRIRAEHTADVFNIAGAAALNRPSQGGGTGGTSLSFGASAAVNDLSTTVLALIDGAATVTVAGDIALTAGSSPRIEVLTLSGAAVGDSQSSSYGGSGNAAFAGAAAGSQNTVNNVTEALIRNAPDVNATDGGSVSLEAGDTATIIADAGGVALVRAGGTAGSLGASVAINKIGGDESGEEHRITAAIDSSTVNSAGGVDIAAMSNPTIDALTLAGAATSAQQSGGGGLALTGAGAGSQNRACSTVEAAIEGASTVTTAGGQSVTLLASDGSDITADAGGAALSSTQDERDSVTVGAAAAVNDIANTVTAAIDLESGASVTSSGGIEQSATSAAMIDVLTIGIAVAMQGGQGGGLSFAGAGAGSGNTVANTVAASIAGGTVRANGGTIGLTALDDTTIHADAGGVALILGGGTPIAIGVGVAANDVDNAVRARIEGAEIPAAQGVSLDATSTSTIDALAFAGGGDLPATTTSQGGGFSAEGAGAVTLNEVNNTVESSIVNSTVAKSDGTAIGGDVTLIAMDESTIKADSGAGALKLKLGGSSSSGGLDIIVGAAAAVNDIGNTVTAKIEGSTVNITGDVDLDAISKATIDTFTFGIAANIATGQAGGFSLTGAGSGSGNTVSNTVEALIHGSVIIPGGAVTLDARDETTVTADAGGAALAIAATQSSDISFAVAVSVAVNDIDNTVRAQIDNATVTDADHVHLTAISTSTIEALTIAGTGDFGTSGGLEFAGAGAGSENKVDNIVEALISGASHVSTAEGPVTLTAAEQGEDLFNLDPAFADKLDDIATVDDAEGDANLLSALRDEFAAHDVSVSEDLSVIALKQGQKWLVKDLNGRSYIIQRDGDDLKVFQPSLIKADAGGGAIGVTVSGGGSLEVSLGAAAAVNEVSNTVRASIDDSTITSSAGVHLEATSTALIDVFTMGIAGAVGVSGGANLSFAGAGSGSSNTVANTVEASIKDNSTVTPGGEVTLLALDDSVIIADAGAVAVAVAVSSGGSFTPAVGISVAINDIGNTVLATIDGSTISDADTVVVRATSAATIEALTFAGTGSVGVSSGATLAFGGAGAGSANTVNNVVEALIRNGSSVTTNGGSVTLTATDDSTINADAGSGALALAVGQGGGVAIAIGAAAATNDIANEIRAAIMDSTVAGAGALTVNALSTAGIDVLAVGIAGTIGVGGEGVGVGFSGSGAGSRNTVGNVIEVAIGGSEVTQVGPVSLTADDQSEIKADASGAGLALAFGTGAAAVSIGFSISLNEIGNTTRAMIDGSTVESTDAITLAATSTADIDVLAVGASLSVAGGGIAIDNADVGAVTTNDIENSTEAFIRDSGASAANAILLTASDNSEMTSDAVAGALSIAASGGASVSVTLGAAVSLNDIENTVASGIDNSDVESSLGDVTVLATSTSTVNATPVVATVDVAAAPASVSASLNAAVAENNTANTVAAFVRSGSTVHASGGVRVDASDTSSATATVAAVAVSGGVAGVGGGASVSHSTVDNTVAAFIEDATVTASGGDIAVVADATQTIVSDATAVAASFSIGGAGSGAESTATINGCVEAYANNATLTATDGNVVVEATSALAADADANGGAAGSLLALAVMFPTAEIAGATRAFVSGSTGVNSGNVDVMADGTYAATANTLTTGLSLFASGVGARATTTVSRDTEAYVGTRADAAASGSPSVITVTDGNILVQASSDSTATTNAKGGTVSQAAIAGLVGDATISGATRAYVGKATTVTAGELDVLATATGDATAHNLAVGAGLISGTGANANATVSGDVEAFVGAQAALTVDGAVTVHATSTSEATAESKGVSVGAVEVTVMLADSEISGATRSYIGDGATVHAAGLDVKANATHTPTAEALGVGISAVGGDGATATSKDTSTVEAFIGPPTGTESGATTPTQVTVAGDVDVDATLNTTVTATTDVVGVGILADGAGSKTVADASPTVQAYLGDKAKVTADNDVTFGAVVTADVSADGFGVSASGVFAAGGAVVEASLEPVVKAFTESGGSIDAANIALASRLNVDENGDAVHPVDDEGDPVFNLRAAGTVGSGALVAAAAGADVDGVNSPTIETKVGPDTSISASAKVTLESLALQDADADALSVGASLIAGVGTTLADATAQGSIQTHFDGLLLSAESVSLTSRVTAQTDAFGEANGGGLLAGIGTNVNAATSPAVDTFVGPTGKVTATNDVAIESIVMTNADANSEGVVASIVASVGCMPATATVAPTISTYLAEDARVESNDGSVSLLSAHNFDPLAEGGDGGGAFNQVNAARANSGSLGISVLVNIDVEAGKTDITATSEAEVDTYVEQGATILANSGEVSLKSYSSNKADAKLKNNGGALVSVTVGNLTATAGGTTEARLLGHVREPDGTESKAGASNITVLAEALDIATSKLETYTVGPVVEVNVSKATAEANPDIRAEIGGSGSVIRAAGDVTVTSYSETDADASIDAGGGGIVRVGDFNADVTTEPSVTTEVAGGSDIAAGGTIRLAATHGAEPLPVSDGRFYYYPDSDEDGVDESQNTITFADPHCLRTGDTVVYDSGGRLAFGAYYSLTWYPNDPVGGLEDGRRYGVLEVDDCTLELGASFPGAEVNLDNDTIVFGQIIDGEFIPQPHQLKDGDCVIYQVPNGSSAVESLEAGKQYKVNRIDATTIKLVDPDQPLKPTHQFNPSSEVPGSDPPRKVLEDDEFFIPGHGFETDQAVTYRAPQTIKINPDFVDVKLAYSASGGAFTRSGAMTTSCSKIPAITTSSLATRLS